MNISSVALSGQNRGSARIDGVERRTFSGPEDTRDLSSGAMTLIQAKNDFACRVMSLKVTHDLNKHGLPLKE
jgi:hypothetical protein